MALSLEALDAALPELESLDCLNVAISEPTALRPEQLSFGIVADAKAGWSRVEAEIQGHLSHLWQQLVACAYVESQVNGRLLARSRVSYASDTQTWWNAPLPVEQMELHHASLAHALALRMRLLELMVLALRLFTGFSAAMANPLLAVSALSNAAKLAARLEEILTG